MITTRRARIAAAAAGGLIAAAGLSLTLDGTAEAAVPGPGPEPGMAAAVGGPQIMCMDIYTPVLGSDGKVYSNDCYARRAGVSVVGPAPGQPAPGQPAPGQPGPVTLPGMQVPPPPGTPIDPPGMAVQARVAPGLYGGLGIWIPWPLAQGPGTPGWVNSHGPAPVTVQVNGQGSAYAQSSANAQSSASGQGSGYGQESGYGQGSGYDQNPGEYQGPTPDENALCPTNLPPGAVC